MHNPSISKLPITRIEDGKESSLEDTLAVEEPMEIRMIFGPAETRTTKSISITMRTPGNDLELAAGFLFTEGIIHSQAEIEGVTHLAYDENIVQVSLQPHISPALAKLERNFYTTSSCGVCGKTSIESVRTVSSRQSSNDNWQIPGSLLYDLPKKLRQSQDVFESTGGLHASALFDKEGNLILLREDVGRHNALDKLIGAALGTGILPLDNYILLLSGRASFELIQKAAMAGIQLVAAVGAPSSLAVSLAQEFNMTLVGFLKPGRFNVYCGKERIIF